MPAKNEGEDFIRCKTSSKLEEKLEQFNLEAKMEPLKTNLTKLIETRVDEAMNTTSANVEDTYAKVVARSIPKKNETSYSKKDKKYDNDNIKDSFRIQDIPEDVEKSCGENLVPPTEKFNDVLMTIGVQPQIKEMKRLGKFSKEQAKPRTLLVTVSIEHKTSMALAKNETNLRLRSLSKVRIN